ncbi:hypothetical protein BH20ACI2_BH20ACI2_21460 [soil metagenome]
MHKKFVLFLGLLVASATLSFAQVNNFQAPTAIKLAAGGAVSDPFGLLESDDDEGVKASEVKSSVIINMASAERLAFDLINQMRAENGLRPLEWSDEIAMVARIHSQNMAEFKFFGHRGLDNKLVSDRADQLRLGKWRAIGENIAYNRGYKNPVEKAVDNWLNSQSHRHNLLNSEWKESAVGVAVGDDGSYYFTQVFLRK